MGWQARKITPNCPMNALSRRSSSPCFYSVSNHVLICGRGWAVTLQAVLALRSWFDVALKADGMQSLERLQLVESLQAYARGERPMLGICLGMQLLFEVGEEFGEHTSLGSLPGRVVLLPSRRQDGARLKIPRPAGASCSFPPRNGSGPVRFSRDFPRRWRLTLSIRARRNPPTPNMCWPVRITVVGPPRPWCIPLRCWAASVILKRVVRSDCRTSGISSTRSSKGLLPCTSRDRAIFPMNVREHANG